MDWDKMRNQWRDAAPAAPLMAVDELRALDASLWKKVRRRDMVETVAAVVVVIFFALTALGTMAEREWVQAGFALLIVAWAAWLPFQLRRARLAAEVDGRAVSILDHLRRQRDAALEQARMLERVWLWYLTPPATGLVGLTLARDGVTKGALIYIASALLLYAGIAWLNRRTARTRFRAHADTLRRQIRELEQDAG
ncbi:hypothetical protein [Luteimonas sp. MC1895]|uniref:hypothetical protein n=1 Tax=Luteimonas sp. MC1895 TaxID=2819513 RepID=UPI0018F0BE1D|nr:hypothetical protein [Luteimonas sp. MC1895]MBJ6979653.1 hypothetical protein [Luteimonas sp. MC1895]